MKVLRLQARRTQSSGRTQICRGCGGVRRATLRSTRVRQSLPKKRFDSLGLHFYLLLDVLNVRIDRLFNAIMDLLMV